MGQLIALNKSSGFHPIGTRETWRRLFEKVVLKCCGEEATTACGSIQLYADLKAGIEGSIHAANCIWNRFTTEEE